MYVIADGLHATASSGPERRRTSDHRRIRRDHVSPVLWQLHWLPVRQRVQFKLAVLVFKALHGQAPQCLTDDCQLVAAGGHRLLRSSDVVRHMFVSEMTYTVSSGTLNSSIPYHTVTCLVPRTRTCLGGRSCVWRCWTTSVERFADQPPSASPLPWTVPTGAKTHLF